MNGAQFEPERRFNLSELGEYDPKTFLFKLFKRCTAKSEVNHAESQTEILTVYLVLLRMYRILCVYLLDKHGSSVYHTNIVGALCQSQFYFIPEMENFMSITILLYSRDGNFIENNNIKWTILKSDHQNNATLKIRIVILMVEINLKIT